MPLSLLSCKTWWKQSSKRNEIERFLPRVGKSTKGWQICSLLFFPLPRHSQLLKERGRLGDGHPWAGPLEGKMGEDMYAELSWLCCP